MKNTRIAFIVIIFFLCLRLSYSSDFAESQVVVHTINNPSPGYLFMGPFTGDFIAAYDNAGKKVKLSDIPSNRAAYTLLNFQIQPNGMITFFDGSVGMYYGMNSNFNIVDSFYCIGKDTDFHDLFVLPNGDAYLIAEYFREMDLSQIVQGGKTNARVRYFTIQHIDKNKNLLWEWDTYNHFDILDATPDVNLTASTVNFIHMNSLFVDTDGNIIVCSRHLDEITKINRQTGEIMWRMGGKYCKNNQFAFINDTLDGFWGFSHQHDVQRLPNGNLLILDNGNLKPNHYSRAVEYQIDEENLIATKVWEYRKDPDVFVPWMGSVQRLPNGNTLIGWGAATSVEHEESIIDTTLSATEVRPDGTIAYEMSLVNTMSYRVYRFPVKMDYITKNINGSGTYDFNDSQYQTKIKLLINQINRGGQLTVERHNFSPLYTDFYGSNACVIYPYRWVITSSEISSIKGVIKIDLNGLSKIDLLGDLKIYKRNQEVYGQFVKLETHYNSTTKELTANFEGLGEFIVASENLVPPKIPRPANLAGGINVSSRLVWNNVYGAFKYQVQLSKDSTFANVLYDIDVINDTTMSFYELDYFTKYYWRVRSFNERCSSQWSDVWSFSTTLNAPELGSPVNNERDVYPKTTFRWTVVQGATLYRLQVDTDSTFKQPKFDVDNIATNFYEVNGLEYNKTYFWRVQAKRQDATSRWSNVNYFRTILATPKLSKPISGAVGQPIEGFIEWGKVSGAEYYRIQIADNPSFQTPIIDVGGIMEARYKYDSLQYETKYYWRVQAQSIYSRSDFCDADSFKTIHSAPKLSKPKNNSINIPLSLDFGWVFRPIYKYYRLQISEDSSFTEIIFDVDSIGNTHIFIENLKHNHTYYWRVNATNDEGTSPWSEIWEFTTRGSDVLPQPVALNPQSGQYGVPLTGYLTWHAVPNATKYRVQLALDPEFTNVIMDVKEIGILSVAYSGLQYYTDYYWRVNARNNFASSDWSDAYHFKTKIQSPELLSPHLNEENVPINGYLIWSEATGAEKYHLQLSDDYNFSYNIIDEYEITQPKFAYSQLNSETKYFWRVRGYDKHSFSDWSPIWSFQTDKSVSVNQVDFDYFDLYPNPTNGIIRIVLNSELDDFLNLDVKNLLGKIIVRVESINPNEKVLDLDLSSYSAGIYFVTINTKKRIITKEILLIK